MFPDRTWAEIDLDALRHNAAVARASCGHRLLAVVKANAYGHGVIPCAHALRDLVDAFAVASLHEAITLKESGIHHPIWILGACLPWEREAVITHGFHAHASSLQEAHEWSEIAQELRREAQLGMFLDTGMGREGFYPQEWDAETLQRLGNLKNVQWKGLLSHFSAADEDEEFTLHQITLFRQLLSQTPENLLAKNHSDFMIGNSAGIMGFASHYQGECNLSRAGIMLYGSSPFAELQKLLKPVLTWKARITLVRTPPLGWGISYGRTHRIGLPDRRIATVSVGYADGYPRLLSGKGAEALVRGVRCPVLGRVTMDSIMLDVTHVGEVSQGEEVVLLGQQDDEQITVAELSQKAQTISYEIFTGIQERVVRHYLNTPFPSSIASHGSCP